MVLDPFSATLAIFGTCVTVLNVGISTVSNIADKKNEWVECEDRLASYRNQIADCKKDIEKWKNDWCDRTRADEDYVHFWGRKGYEGVLERIRLIERYSPKLERHLPTSKQSDTNFWAHIEEPKVSLWQKVRLTSYKSSTLKDAISRMQGMINSLRTHSLQHFEEMHDCNLSGREMRALLEELLRAKRWRTEFAQWMDNLYKPLPSSEDTSWGLLLQLPMGKEGIEPNDEKLSVQITKGLEDDQDQAHIIELTYERDESLQRPVPIVSQHMNGSDVISRGLWRSPFSFPGLIHPRGFATELERHRTALELAAWTFPLLRTGWTTRICSCILGLVDCEEDDRASVLYSATIHSCRRHRRRDDGHEDGIEDGHELALLGIALAELILAESLHITEIMAQGGKELCVKSGENRLRFQALLTKIGDKNLVYSDAVKYCLDLDEKLKQDFVWAQDYNRFFRNVLKP